MKNLFNVPVELYQLEKVVLNKNKSAKVDYKIIDDRGDKNDVFVGSMTLNHQCAMALQNKISELKPFLMKLRHKPEMDKAKVQVKGLVWKGEGEKEAFAILGVEQSDSEKNMVCDSAVEHISAGNYDFLTEVRDLIIEIEVLTHGYIFERKIADMTMDLSNANDSEEPQEADIVDPDESANE